MFSIHSFPHYTVCLLSICSPFCDADPDGTTEIYRWGRVKGSPATLTRFYVSFKMSVLESQKECLPIKRPNSYWKLSLGSFEHFFPGIDFDSDSKEKDNDFAESFLLMQCVYDKAVSFLTGENLNVES